MCINPHHGFGDHLVASALSIDVQPLFKPVYEGLLGDRSRLLAADAAAKQVVKATASFEQAAVASGLIFAGNYVFHYHVSGFLVLLVGCCTHAVFWRFRLSEERFLCRAHYANVDFGEGCRLRILEDDVVDVVVLILRVLILFAHGVLFIYNIK